MICLFLSYPLRCTLHLDIHIPRVIPISPRKQNAWLSNAGTRRIAPWYTRISNAFCTWRCTGTWQTSLLVPRGLLGRTRSVHCNIHWLLVYLRVADSGSLCGLVVRVPGYRSRGLGFHSRRYEIFWVVVGLERGPLNLVSTIEELLGRNSSGSGLENREYGHRGPLC
jgi:hypothetical protein